MKILVKQCLLNIQKQTCILQKGVKMIKYFFLSCAAEFIIILLQNSNNMSQHKPNRKEQQAFQHLKSQQFHHQGLHTDQLSVQNQSQPDSFRGNYQTRLLHSKINELEIERQKIIMYYENELQREKQRMTELQQMNFNMNEQNKAMYEKIQQLTDQLNQIAQQNDNLRRQLQTQFQSYNKSRQFTPFNKDSSNTMNMTDKQQMNQQQQQYINTIKNMFDKQAEDFQQQNQIQSQYLKLEQKYNSEIEQLRQNQINIKRTYENMLQSKENIIRKLTGISNEGSKHQLAQKNKIIADLQKQVNQYFHLLQEEKAQCQNLQKKLNQQEDERMMSLYQSLKEKSNIQVLTQRNVEKKQKNDEQFICSNSKESLVFSDLQNQFSSIQPQIFVLNQNRIIMEQTIRQLQENISSLQTKLNQQVKINSALKQQHNAQVARLLKKLQIIEKKLERSEEQYQRSLQQKQKQIQRLTNQIMMLELYKSKFPNKQRETVDMGPMLDQISEIQQKAKSHIYFNLQKENLRLKDENQSMRKSLQALNLKYKEKNQKIHQNQQKIRSQYNQRIKSLEAQLIKLTKCEQNSAIDNLNSGIKKNSDTKDQLQRLKLVNEILEMQKVQKDEEIKKIAQQLEEKTNTLKIVEDNLKKAQKQFKDKKEDYRQLQILYQDLEQKFKNGVKDLQAQIQDMNQSLLNEKKKNDLKKQQSKKNEEKLLNEVKKLRNIINELEQELQDSKENKGKQMNEMEQKIQKLAHQILVINKQRQSMMKANELDMKNKCKAFEEERQKINEYVLQLEEKCELLFDKAQHLEYKNEELTQNLVEMQQYEETFKNMERDNYELKVELSEALNQINQTLQKYKELQQKFQDILSQQEMIRQKYNNLHQKYCDLCQQKSKNIVQLDNCYDQIQKLNKVLMNKEKQLVRNKAESRWYANSPNQSQIPLSPRQMHSSPQKSNIIQVNQNRISKLDVSPNPTFFTPHNPRNIVSPQQLKINKYFKPQNYSTGVNSTVPSKPLYGYY